MGLDQRHEYLAERVMACCQDLASKVESFAPQNTLFNPRLNAPHLSQSHSAEAPASPGQVLGTTSMSARAPVKEMKSSVHGAIHVLGQELLCMQNVKSIRNLLTTSIEKELKRETSEESLGRCSSASVHPRQSLPRSRQSTPTRSTTTVGSGSLKAAAVVRRSSPVSSPTLFPRAMAPPPRAVAPPPRMGGSLTVRNSI